jgi:hypothetical protein
VPPTEPPPRLEMPQTGRKLSAATVGRVPLSTVTASSALSRARLDSQRGATGARIFFLPPAEIGALEPSMEPLLEPLERVISRGKGSGRHERVSLAP